MFNRKKREITVLKSKLKRVVESEVRTAERALSEAKYSDELIEKHAAEIKKIKAELEKGLQDLQHALSQQANEHRYILLEVARIGDVNLEAYLKSNQYEKRPNVNFKQLREDLQAHDREIERVARLDSLGPTAIKE